MPNLNDFYAFKMSGGDSGGGGCLSKILIAVVVIGLISLLGQCGGWRIINHFCTFAF